ncbi:P-loop containing nucleoside triphosphate hydrolase protein [Pilobolus umbonatus]|nr:P-loop containing nucleoside triphosphate hydrolase protein [Pilobolus umbonatus]
MTVIPSPLPPPIPPSTLNDHLAVTDSRLLKKSISISSTHCSLLPRPIRSTSSGIPHKQKSTKERRQRATLTPKLTQSERLRSNGTVPKLPTTNWISGIFSSPPTKEKKKKHVKGVIRLSQENGKINNRDWQLVKESTSTSSIRYVAPKSSKKFEFDAIFRESTLNREIYDACASAIVEDVVHGYSGTLFTYGQPRTGTKYDPGIIPLALETVFDTISRSSPMYEYLVLLSYYEINNEIIRDLLVEPIYEDPPELKISDDNKRRGAYVAPLKEEIVVSSYQAMQYIMKGEANRYISSIQYKSHHSRSHTFMLLTVERKETGTHSTSTPSVKSNSSTSTTTTASTMRKTKSPRTNKQGNLQVSYLHLIDMASNDKSIYQIHKNSINKSCLALEAIVHNLSEVGKSAGHPSPPYHDSKLTRLLQPMFLGHSNALCICTVDMEAAARDEIPTLDTFNFANRIRRIPVSPKVTELNEDRSSLMKLRKYITLLNSKWDRLMMEQNETDMSELKNALGQKIHEKSSCVLSSKQPVYLPVEDETDPWKTVEYLRNKLDRMEHEKEEEIIQLKAVIAENKGLPDRIAQLEAELNMTQAELQVAHLFVSESPHRLPQ